MEIATTIAVKLHMIAAMYWTGAIIFLAAVASPLANLIRPPSFQRHFTRRLWQVAHRSLWISVAVLVLSGSFLMWRANALNLSILSKAYFSTPMGRKLSLVVFMVLLSLTHDLFMGPGARTKDPQASTDPPGMVATSIPWILALAAVTVTILSVEMRP